jgi:signal transduction histidine kinase/ActR/RegA family two-component response regulator
MKGQRRRPPGSYAGAPRGAMVCNDSRDDNPAGGALYSGRVVLIGRSRLFNPSRRGFKLAVSLVATLAFAMVVTARAVDLRSQRRQLLQLGERRAANLAVVLTGYLRQTFAAVDASLRQLALHSQRIGGPGAPESDWGPALVSARAALTAAGSISVVDSNGIIRHSTQPAIFGQSRRDQYVFRRLASDTTADLVADPPFQAVAGRRGYIIPFGRRLSGRNGAFDGIIVATFIPDELREVFRSADVGKRGVVTVFHRGGFVVFREPSDKNPIGQVATTQPLFEAAMRAGGNGVFRGRADPNGPILRTVFRALPERDLIVAVSLSEDDLLGEWTRDRAISIRVGVLFTLALGAILFLVFREMDTRAAAQETLSRSQRLESIGRLTGGIAHDFNNLLTVILGNVALINEGLDRAPLEATQQSVSQIERAAARGSALIRQLLAFARRQPLQPRTVDLDAMIRDSKPMLDRILGEDVTLRLVVAPSEQLFLATVDPVGAESALLNLCINARDAMRNGGVITIELARATFGQQDARANTEIVPGSYVVIRVNDTGTGIPDEHLARLFEPFFTTKDVGGGTGLGLSMVYGFVKQSGGFVKVDSAVGRGTTVDLYFPESRDAAPTATSNEPEEIARGNGETVLLVEDEPALLALVTRLVEDLGYRAIGAENGAAALAVARRLEQIDLLLTDIVMPGGMSGRQLAGELRVRHPGLPVVYMSGYSDPTADRADTLADAEVIAKPYERARLATALHKALTANRRAARVAD